MCQPAAMEQPGAVCPRPPTARPEFTVKTLRQAIPEHCFQRSLVKSFGYLFADLLAVAALYAASTYFERAPAMLAWGLLWPAYWFWQGAVCTGIWVIAHECGHGARMGSSGAGAGRVTLVQQMAAWRRRVSGSGRARPLPAPVMTPSFTRRRVLRLQLAERRRGLHLSLLPAGAVLQLVSPHLGIRTCAAARRGRC